MAHIPRVGRKSPKLRLLLASIYFVLVLGAVTTIYPFLVMLGASISSEYDQDQYRVIPKFLVSDRALFGKYVSDKYNGDLTAINNTYGANYAKLGLIAPPPSGDAEILTKWHAFVQALPPEYKTTGFRGTPGQYAPAPTVDHYRTWLRARFHDDIHALDEAYTEEDTNFLSVFPPTERLQQRLYRPSQSPKDRDWAQFKADLSPSEIVPFLCDPLYRKFLHDERYGGKIDQLNAAWSTHYSDFTQIVLPATLPAQAAQAADWTAFVRNKLPLRFLALAPKPAGPLPSGTALEALASAVRQADPHRLSVASTETMWRAAVHDPNATLPIAQDDWDATRRNARALRLDFVTRNYAFALNYLLLHGRGILNTVIFCSGAVLSALLVNPLCAYALSRFRLPYASSVLLFLLATMAFPAEVALIPNFLLLKQLGLLNTFWALILPGAASGFSIFLLKGFFDSLPKELYEAGMIDGASEMTLFRKVTLPLSKPIFAVIALQAFGGAYGAFLFAMIVCQAQSHWTLMVWIYEFQALAAPQYVVMAALVIAALPSLIVFMFTQRIIMRGIILPSFK